MEMGCMPEEAELAAWAEDARNSDGEAADVCDCDDGMVRHHLKDLKKNCNARRFMEIVWPDYSRVPEEEQATDYMKQLYRGSLIMAREYMRSNIRCSYTLSEDCIEWRRYRNCILLDWVPLRKNIHQFVTEPGAADCFTEPELMDLYQDFLSNGFPTSLLDELAEAKGDPAAYQTATAEILYSIRDIGLLAEAFAMVEAEIFQDWLLDHPQANKALVKPMDIWHVKKAMKK